MIGTVIVVDDEVQAREEIRTKGDHALIVFPCRCRYEAMRAVVSERVIGIIIDYRLIEDGEVYSGFDLLAQMRERVPTSPAMIVTAARDPEIQARAEAVGARYANKLLDPGYRKRVEDFFNLVVSEAMDVIPELRAAVYSASQQWDLHPHETLVVAAYNHEWSRSEVARWLRISEETVKSRIRSILKKAQKPNINEIHREILAIARRIQFSTRRG